MEKLPCTEVLAFLDREHRSLGLELSLSDEAAELMERREITI